MNTTQSFKKRVLGFTCAVAFTLPVMGGDCLPENDLSFPVSSNKSAASTHEFQVRRVLERFQRALQPMVTNHLKKTLKIELDWENPRVNASATRDMKNNPIIILYGGMARHPELSPDGLLGILCHELGHHLGGAPRKLRGMSTKRSWSSAEGQADYFAANKCLPLLFNTPTETVNLDALSNKKQVDSAESRCGNDPVCTRIALSGLSMARVFASLKTFYEKPSLEENDQSQVHKTNHGHPYPQCRLDTVVAGALCSVPSTQPFDSLDPYIGACHRQKDEQAKVIGERPRCWFNPEVF